MATDKTRDGATGTGTHAYRVGRYVIRRMGNSRWFAFVDNNGVESDTGHDFRTLRAGRQWAKEQK